MIWKRDYNTEVGYTVIDVVTPEFQGPRALAAGPRLSFAKRGAGDKALEIDISPGHGGVERDTSEDQKG